MAINLQNTNTVSASSIKLLVYGQAGAGKTSLIPTMPKPVILSAEGGRWIASARLLKFALDTKRPKQKTRVRLMAKCRRLWRRPSGHSAICQSTF